MNAKDNYVKPVMTIIIVESCNMFTASSLDVNDEQGDADVDFATVARGEWGNLWSDVQSTGSK
jgi:hypothetical protein